MENEKQLTLIAKKAEAYDLSRRLSELVESHRLVQDRLRDLNAEIAELEREARPVVTD